jgi:hypothetical protein
MLTRPRSRPVCFPCILTQARSGPQGCDHHSGCCGARVLLRGRRGAARPPRTRRGCRGLLRSRGFEMTMKNTATRTPVTTEEGAQPLQTGSPAKRRASTKQAAATELKTTRPARPWTLPWRVASAPLSRAPTAPAPGAAPLHRRRVGWPGRTLGVVFGPAAQTQQQTALKIGESDGYTALSGRPSEVRDEPIVPTDGLSPADPGRPQRDTVGQTPPRAL